MGMGIFTPELDDEDLFRILVPFHRERTPLLGLDGTDL
jgi:hypothetical protein